MVDAPSLSDGEDGLGESSFMNTTSAMPVGPRIREQSLAHFI